MSNIGLSSEEMAILFPETVLPSTTDNINKPVGISEELSRELYPEDYIESDARIKRDKEVFQIGQESLAEDNDFLAGVNRAVDEAQGMYYGLKGFAWQALGNEKYADENLVEANKQLKEAEENPARITEYFSTDKDRGLFGSFDNFTDGVAGLMGSMVPSMATTVLGAAAGATVGGLIIPGADPLDVATVPVGAVAGALSTSSIFKKIAERGANNLIKKEIANLTKKGMSKALIDAEIKKFRNGITKKVIAKQIGGTLGGFAASSAQYMGDEWVDLKNKGYDPNLIGVTAGGILSGALETMIGLDAKFAGHIVSDKTLSTAKKLISAKGAKEASKEVVDLIVDGLLEGVTEGAQEGVGIVSGMMHGDKVKLKEAAHQIAEASLAGFIGGAGFGVVGHGAKKITKEEASVNFEMSENQAVELDADAKRYGITYDRDVNPIVQKRNFIESVAKKIGVSNKKDLEVISAGHLARKEILRSRFRNDISYANLGEDPLTAKARNIDSKVEVELKRLGPKIQEVNDFVLDNEGTKPLIDSSEYFQDGFGAKVEHRMAREQEILGALNEKGLDGLPPELLERYRSYAGLTAIVDKKLKETGLKGKYGIKAQDLLNEFYNQGNVQNVVDAKLLRDYRSMSESFINDLADFQNKANEKILQENTEIAERIKNGKAKENVESIINGTRDSEIEAELAPEGKGFENPRESGETPISSPGEGSFTQEAELLDAETPLGDYYDSFDSEVDDRFEIPEALNIDDIISKYEYFTPELKSELEAELKKISLSTGAVIEYVDTAEIMPAIATCSKGVIKLAPGSDVTTLRHEVFHNLIDNDNFHALNFLETISGFIDEESAEFQKLIYNNSSEDYDLVHSTMVAYEEVAALSFGEPEVGKAFIKKEFHDTFDFLVSWFDKWDNITNAQNIGFDDKVIWNMTDLQKLDKVLSQFNPETKQELKKVSLKKSTWGSNWVGFVKDQFELIPFSLKAIPEQDFMSDNKYRKSIIKSISDKELRAILNTLANEGLFSVLLNISSLNIEKHFKYNKSGTKLVYHDFEKAYSFQTTMVKEDKSSQFKELLDDIPKEYNTSGGEPYWNFVNNLLGVPSSYREPFLEFIKKAHNRKAFYAIKSSQLNWNYVDSKNEIASIRMPLLQAMKHGEHNKNGVNSVRFLQQYFYEKDPLTQFDGLMGRFLNSKELSRYSPIHFRREDGTSATAMIQSSQLNNTFGEKDNLGQLQEVVGLNGNYKLIDDISSDDFQSVVKKSFHESENTFELWLGQMADKGSFNTVTVEKYHSGAAYDLYVRLYDDHIKSISDINETISDPEKKIKSLLADPNGKEIRDAVALHGSAIVYNYAYHLADRGEKLFGKLTTENYKNTLDLVKRAGSSISTGTTMFGETSTKEFSHLTVNESLLSMKELKDASDGFDGLLLVRDSMMKDMKTGFGENFFKPGELAAVKCVYSVTAQNKLRGLTKANMVSVDELALTSTLYRDIRDIMNANGIDSLSTTSSTKISEGGVTFNMFDDSGELISDFYNTDGTVSSKSIIDKKTHFVTRTYGNINVLQDLNGPTVAKDKNQISQLQFNLISTPGYELRTKAHKESVDKKFKELNENRVESIISKLDPINDIDVITHLRNGGLLHNPVFERQINIAHRNLVEEATEIIVKMSSHQAVPVGRGNVLKQYRQENGKMYLPEFLVNIEGLRYKGEAPTALAEYAGAWEFDSKEELEALILRNHRLLKDMIDKDGNVLTHEFIQLESGKWTTPGEIVRVSRVPADNYHSHMIGRASGKVGSGKHNLIMTDPVTQVIAGEDFDGDKRYVESLSHDGGLIDQALIADMQYMYTPEAYPKFVEEIDLDFLKDRVFKTKEEAVAWASKRKFHPRISINEKGEYVVSGVISAVASESELKSSNISFNNIQTQFEARRSNLDGKEGLAIIASQKTLMDTLEKFKPRIMVEVEDGEFRLRYVKDTQGKLRSFFGVLLNLAADNGKEGQLFPLGLNKYTLPLFFYKMITDRSLIEYLHLDNVDHEILIQDAVVRNIKFIKNDPETKAIINYKKMEDSIYFLEHEHDIKPKNTYDFKNMNLIGELLFLIKARKKSFKDIKEFAHSASIINGFNFMVKNNTYIRDVDFFAPAMKNIEANKSFFKDHFSMSDTYRALKVNAPFSILNNFYYYAEQMFLIDMVDSILNGRTPQSLATTIREAYTRHPNNRFLNALDLSNPKILLKLQARNIQPEDIKLYRESFLELDAETQSDLIAYHFLEIGFTPNINKGYYLELIGGHEIDDIYKKTLDKWNNEISTLDIADMYLKIGISLDNVIPKETRIQGDQQIALYNQIALQRAKIIELDKKGEADIDLENYTHELIKKLLKLQNSKNSMFTSGLEATKEELMVELADLDVRIKRKSSGDDKGTFYQNWSISSMKKKAKTLADQIYQFDLKDNPEYFKKKELMPKAKTTSKTEDTSVVMNPKDRFYSRILTNKVSKEKVMKQMLWTSFSPEYKPIDNAKDAVKWLNEGWFVSRSKVQLLAQGQAAKIADLIREKNPNASASELELLDQAIHFRLNSNEDIFNNIKVPEKEQRIIEAARNLSPANIEVVQALDEMYGEYKKIYKVKTSKDKENELYAPQIWNTDYDGYSAGIFSDAILAKYPKYKKSREYKNIMAGLDAGLELKYYGATENVKQYILGMAQYKEDTKMIETGLSTFSSDGLTLLSYDALPGYVKIDHPTFNKEDKAIYAQAHLAEELNRIVKSSAFSTPFWKGVMTFSSVMKQFILQASLFHYKALTNSFLFGKAKFKLSDLNIKKAVAEGIEVHNKAIRIDPDSYRDLAEASEEIILNYLYVEGGLTHFTATDFDETVYNKSNFISRALDKNSLTKYAKDKALSISKAYGSHLFGRWGTAFKAKAAIAEFQYLIEKGYEPAEAARQSANIINNDFGGINTDRNSRIMGVFKRSKTNQDVFRLLCLAPDWTESNALVMRDIFADPLGKTPQGRVARTLMARVLFRGIIASSVMNVLMAMVSKMSADDDEDKDIVDIFRDTLSDAWSQGDLAWLDVDVSPLAALFGVPDDVKYYFPTIGHFKDYLGLIPNIDDLNLVEDAKEIAHFAHGKSSTIFKLVEHLVLGSDFAGREYTTVSELMESGKLVTNKKTTEDGSSRTRLDQALSFGISSFTGLMPISLKSSVEGIITQKPDGIKILSDLTALQLEKGDKSKIKIDHIGYIGKALNAVRDLIPSIGEPISVDIQNLSGEDMLDAGSFHILYSDKNKTAKAVFERLTPDMIKQTGVHRGANFRADSKNKKSLDTSGFTAKGSVRGHLAAAGNYNTYVSKDDTFVMTNIAHQNPEFNNGLWKRLEEEIRDMAKKDEMVVITAPVLDDWIMTTAGAENVTVPKRFVKIAANQNTGVITAWLMNNEQAAKSTKAFEVSLKDAEKVTGLKFKNLR